MRKPGGSVQATMDREWATDEPIEVSEEARRRHSRKLLRIADRDGWLCGICRMPVSPNRYIGTAPRGERGRNKAPRNAPSLDHILPRSLGGSNRDDNLRLTHARCNWQRRQGFPGEPELATNPNYVKPKPKELKKVRRWVHARGLVSDSGRPQASPLGIESMIEQPPTSCNCAPGQAEMGQAGPDCPVHCEQAWPYRQVPPPSEKVT